MSLVLEHEGIEFIDRDSYREMIAKRDRYHDLLVAIFEAAGHSDAVLFNAVMHAKRLYERERSDA